MEGILEVGGPDKLLHVLQPAALQRFQQAAVADKISRVVRTLTHAMRYETVATMLNTGRGEELIAAPYLVKVLSRIKKA